MAEPELKGFNLQEAESTLRQVLSYRVWFDQRRGWRYTNPNLEQLGLVEVEYLGLEDLVADESVFADAPSVLRLASPAVRAAVRRRRAAPNGASAQASSPLAELSCMTASMFSRTVSSWKKAFC